MRVAIGIEYDGSSYVGWQSQKSGVGIQSLVEKSIGVVANEPIKVVCAGRTDTGVHAAGQVVHFDTKANRSERGWVLGINSNLPDDVSARWAVEVSEEFHARFSATSRSYTYQILNQTVRSALLHRKAWWVHADLDADAMQLAANDLLGRHDFSSFRAAGCQAHTPVREITVLSIIRQDKWIRIHVQANAFLQHMVRNITGVLVAIGKGEKPHNWAAEVLAARDRTKGGVAAPPHGLTLVGVTYPEQFAIPANSAVNEIRL